jgi:hypothetical protein
MDSQCDDIMQSVFAFANYRSVLALPLVCKRWRRLMKKTTVVPDWRRLQVYDVELWARCFPRAKQLSCRDERLETHQSMSTWCTLKRLTHIECFFIPTRAIELGFLSNLVFLRLRLGQAYSVQSELHKCMPNLLDLEVTDNFTWWYSEDHDSDANIRGLAGPTLRSLSTQNANFKWFHKEPSVFTNIHTLDLTNTTSGNTGVCNDSIRQLRSLRVLNLTHVCARRLTDDAFPESTQIHTLNLAYSDTKITGSCFERMHCLRHLNMSNRPLLHSKLYRHLGNLLSLDLSDPIRHLDPHGVMRTIETHDIAHLKSIVTLVLSGTQIPVNPRVFLTLPQLKHLDLSFSRLSPIFVSHAFHNQPAKSSKLSALFHAITQHTEVLNIRGAYF